ncbi:GNAT family N-acetyltransferase [Candidatus Sumerlaeota bacterium]|nr:GNAT family N-acetyltransferase [Candidatus Sumerlaeota bacterium]
MVTRAFINGKKIFLRPVELEDAEFLAFCLNSPDIRPTFFTNFPTNASRQTELIRNLYKDSREYVPFIICEKKQGQAVGITAFHRMDLVSRTAIYSIIIPEKKNWDKGYGTEATRLMVAYGFDVLNLNRIQLHVSALNTRGIKVYENVGFVKEGLLRQAMYHNDEYCDFYVMAILRQEYYQRKEK